MKEKFCRYVELRRGFVFTVFFIHYSPQVVVLEWCLIDKPHSLRVKGLHGNHEASLQELTLSLPDTIKGPGVLATLRNIYSQRLDIIGVALVLLYAYNNFTLYIKPKFVSPPPPKKLSSFAPGGGQDRESFVNILA